MGRRTASSSASEAVRVVTRCRPMSETEKANKCKRVVEVDSASGTMRITNPAAEKSEPPKTFTFDAVYGPFSKQKEVFNETALPIVDSVLNGFNGTIFAYGQTGTGKTWTMAGNDKSSETKGIIPNSFDHIFNSIGRSQEKQYQQYLVRASYLEIYQNEIKDLLDKNSKGKLDLHESKDHGVYVKGLTSFVVKSIAEIEHVMKAGDPNRTVGATKMNAESSRSHSIFTITIECSTPRGEGEPHICAGKLNLVDLAGSERQAKTQASGQRLAEATKINMSLSALGHVISALVDGKSSHIPYRDSRLTRLLEDSLGGNAKTVMIATLGPTDYNYAESINTLRYANRAKNIKNKPKINEDPKDALLRKYQQEIELLKEKLSSEGKKINHGIGGGERRRRKKKKRIVNSDGESEEVSDSGDDGEVNDDEVERRIAHGREELERERTEILRNKNMLREERDQLLQTLDDRADELERETEQYNEAAKKLKAMEEKLLVGGVNIFDRTKQQERELQEHDRQLAIRKKREVELRQKIEREEEMKLQVEEKFASLEEEVAVKTKKLKKLWSKLMAARTEIKDLKEENRTKREELNETQRALSKDLALQMITVENFIPVEERDKIEKRAYRNGEGEWVLRKIEREDSAQRVKRPVSAIGQKRPISEYARVATALGDMNPRYRSENIMQVKLEMPDRTTSDYVSAGERGDQGRGGGVRVPAYRQN